MNSQRENGSRLAATGSCELLSHFLFLSSKTIGDKNTDVVVSLDPMEKRFGMRRLEKDERDPRGWMNNPTFDIHRTLN